MEKKVNNWKAANELQSFKQQYCDPISKRIDDGREVLADTNRKWASKANKERAKTRFLELDVQNADFHRLYNTVSELVRQHELQTDMLTEIYAQWYNKVSEEGEQPSEMMGSQAVLLQSYFQRIYDAIEPLNIPIHPPKK